MLIGSSINEPPNSVRMYRSISESNLLEMASPPNPAPPGSSRLSKRKRVSAIISKLVFTAGGPPPKALSESDSDNESPTQTEVTPPPCTTYESPSRVVLKDGRRIRHGAIMEEVIGIASRMLVFCSSSCARAGIERECLKVFEEGGVGAIRCSKTGLQEFADVLATLPRTKLDFSQFAKTPKFTSSPRSFRFVYANYITRMKYPFLQNNLSSFFRVFKPKLDLTESLTISGFTASHQSTFRFVSANFDIHCDKKLTLKLENTDLFSRSSIMVKNYFTRILPSKKVSKAKLRLSLSTTPPIYTSCSSLRVSKLKTHKVSELKSGLSELPSTSEFITPPRYRQSRSFRVCKPKSYLSGFPSTSGFITPPRSFHTRSLRVSKPNKDRVSESKPENSEFPSTSGISVPPRSPRPSPSRACKPKTDSVSEPKLELSEFPTTSGLTTPPRSPHSRSFRVSKPESDASESSSSSEFLSPPSLPSERSPNSDSDDLSMLEENLGIGHSHPSLLSRWSKMQFASRVTKQSSNGAADHPRACKPKTDSVSEPKLELSEFPTTSGLTTPPRSPHPRSFRVSKPESDASESSSSSEFLSPPSLPLERSPNSDSDGLSMLEENLSIGRSPPSLLSRWSKIHFASRVTKQSSSGAADHPRAVLSDLDGEFPTQTELPSPILTVSKPKSDSNESSTSSDLFSPPSTPPSTCKLNFKSEILLTPLSSASSPCPRSKGLPKSNSDSSESLDMAKMNYLCQMNNYVFSSQNQPKSVCTTSSVHDFNELLEQKESLVSRRTPPSTSPRLPEVSADSREPTTQSSGGAPHYARSSSSTHRSVTDFYGLPPGSRVTRLTLLSKKSSPTWTKLPKFVKDSSRSARDIPKCAIAYIDDEEYIFCKPPNSGPDKWPREFLRLGNSRAMPAKSGETDGMETVESKDLEAIKEAGEDEKEGKEKRKETEDKKKEEEEIVVVKSIYDDPQPGPSGLQMYSAPINSDSSDSPETKSNVESSLSFSSTRSTSTNGTDDEGESDDFITVYHLASIQLSGE
ncbi:hypothetical protein HHI36_023045 [Cryptolaemus montrouzieri]|uniref:Uncharacterized protein n=1 Tax=Cryptolaemus montrouzieri TaxID=559131 RepID=A0ABD2PF77_9CUCU